MPDMEAKARAEKFLNSPCMCAQTSSRCQVCRLTEALTEAHREGMEEAADFVEWHDKGGTSMAAAIREKINAQEEK